MSHDYVKVTLSEKSFDFDIPEETKGLANCLAEVGEGLSHLSIRNSSQVLALVEILVDAGFTTRAAFGRRARDIEVKLLALKKAKESEGQPGQDPS